MSRRDPKWPAQRRAATVCAAVAALLAAAFGLPAAAQSGGQCEDPGGDCRREMPGDCLSRLGAGALATSPDDATCRARFGAYRDCLALIAAECGATGGGPMASAGGGASIETVWNAIKDSGNPKLFRSFAKDFPNTTLGAAALDKAEKLESGERTAAQEAARSAAAARVQQGGDPFTHQVDGLDPNGDNFLSLKGGPGLSYPRLRKMGPRTLLKILDQKGAWLKVALEDGAVGWAHGNWIKPRAASGGGAAGSGGDCDALWHARNAIWKRYGYCFGSERGVRAFGNEGCFRDLAEASAAMSAADKRQVEQYAERERTLGCK